MGKLILDVGQCGFDGPRLRRMLREKLEAEVDCAETLVEAVQKLETMPYNLVLVNRVLNKDRSSGLAVIEAVRKTRADAKVMLVSDRAEAQKEAIKLGALPGFGKAALQDQKTVEMIGAALGR